jgi:hypothetical protein
VSGVVAALVARDYVEAFGEQINDLTFAFVPPLCPDDYNYHCLFWALAGLFQSDRLFDEIKTAGSRDFFEISSRDGEQSTLIWSVLVYSASCSAIMVLFQKRALEHQFAACTAAIAFALPEGKRCYDFVSTKRGRHESSNLALNLTRTKFRVLNFPRAQPFGEPLFQSSRPEMS